MTEADQTALRYLTGILADDALGARHDHGIYTRKFEERFAGIYRVPFATTLNSGSAALEAALHGCDIGPGDEVIMDPFLKYAPLATVRRRGVPVFADIDGETLTLDSEAVARVITPRTKAVIITALFGYPPDVGPFSAMKQKQPIKLIVDCAQALFAERDGRLTGPEFDCATFSFQASKHLSTGEGGMLITGNQRIFERAIALKDFGWHPGLSDAEVGEGWMYRMPEPIAAIGYARLNRACKTVARHRHLATLMNREMAGLEVVRIFDSTPSVRHAHWTWAIQVTDPAAFDRAERCLVGDDQVLQFGYCRAGLSYERPFFDTYRESDQALATRLRDAYCPRAKNAARQLVHVKINARESDGFYLDLVRRLRKALARQ